MPQYTWIDSLFMSIITISTVGYKEVGGTLPDMGKLWSIFVIAIGLMLITILGTQVAAFVVEGQLRGIFGRRQLEKKISALRGHIIVCGLGRMGKVVATELVEAGRDVVVIENDKEQIVLADQEKLPCVCGDAQEDGVLIAAGIKRASILIVVLSTDAASLFVTLSARQDNPKIFIVARAQEVSNQTKLERAGADRVICPQIIGAGRIADVVLRPAMVDFVEMAHSGVDLEMDQIEVQPGSELLGRTLAELNLSNRYGAHIVAIRKPDGRTNYHPLGDLQLSVGDRIIIVGQEGTSDALAKLQKTGA